jgi:hypothetical protein
MAPSDRYTAGRLRTDLRHIMKKMERPDQGHLDQRLVTLSAAHSIQLELQSMIDQTIILARRNQPALTWREIGDALGISGQAVAQRARARELPVEPLTAEDYRRAVTEAREALRQRS